MAYINRELALKLLGRNSITKSITFADGVSIYDAIADIPAADVVAVVRCKDCKYNAFQQPKGTIHCHAKRNLICEFRSPDDFCSYGERKE